MNNTNKMIIIGVAGASGSGKSLLAHTIVNELGSKKVTVITEDSYYKDLSGLSKAERDKVNFDHPDALDHDLLQSHLSRLQQGQSIDVPIYDYTTHARTDKTTLVSSENTIIVLEGILLFFEPKLRERMDIKLFIDTPLDTCFIRRLKRDVIDRARSMESVISQYEETVRPMFLKFIEPSKKHADIIVPHGGKNRIAIELIQAKMKEMLNNAHTKVS